MRVQITQSPMKTNYQNLLAASIAYLADKGRTQESVDFLMTVLPDAWAANIVGDALMHFTE